MGTNKMTYSPYTESEQQHTKDFTLESMERTINSIYPPTRLRVNPKIYGLLEKLIPEKHVGLPPPMDSLEIVKDYKVKSYRVGF
jgi:hypothetical protein